MLQAAKRTQWVYVWQLSARRAAVIGAHAALDATEWGALEAERDWSDFALNLAFMTAVYLYFSDAGPRVRPPPPAPLRWARGVAMGARLSKQLAQSLPIIPCVSLVY